MIKAVMQLSKFVGISKDIEIQKQPTRFSINNSAMCSFYIVQIMKIDQFHMYVL
jgi:hypothetical protein